MSGTASLALVGCPNCGKSSLFNALTGSRQKVANYPGVTVERRAGTYVTTSGEALQVLDLPGTYSLEGRSPDEEITRAVITGDHEFEAAPDAILCLVDATNLRMHLRFALEVIALGRPTLLVLNMMDLAKRDGIEIDVAALEAALGIPVVPTIAVRRVGIEKLTSVLADDLQQILARVEAGDLKPAAERRDIRTLQKQAREIAEKAIVGEGREHRLTRQIDNVALNPVAGPIILLTILFAMFQAVFSLAETPMDWIDGATVDLQNFLQTQMPDIWLRSLLVDGILAGVGSVVIFLPQIVILFAFVLLLEASGYMARAAFLMDKLMSKVGLNGRAFIPLLSSFACAIPGIMSARSIEHPRDRLTTILIAPLMTCSARLPVYTLIIAAFIPNTSVGPGFGLQGLVMFGLYIAGIVSALAVALILKLTVVKGPSAPLILELPKYQVPGLRDLALGLYERVKIFLRRAGTIILWAMIVLWGLASFPSKPVGASEPDIYYSLAGLLGRGLNVVLAPIGFNWEISIALIPGMAAREVAVAALGTVYALSGDEDQVAEHLSTTLQSAWSLPTALAFLAWYIFAPQCLATLAVARRETNSWKWPIFMFSYLLGMAYIAAGAVYWGAIGLGW